MHNHQVTSHSVSLTLYHLQLFHILPLRVTHFSSQQPGSPLRSYNLGHPTVDRTSYVYSLATHTWDQTFPLQFILNLGLNFLFPAL